MSDLNKGSVGGILAAVVASGLVAAATVPARAAEPAQTTVSRVAAPASATYRAVLDRYCITCHNDRLRTANLSLAAISLERVGESPVLWEKVAAKVRSRAMPPAGRPRPDRATYDGLSSWLETELDRAAAAHPNPGRSTVHRLNRAEYTNVVRDLLALEIDAQSLLPADEMAYGFDNIADLLSVSPGLLERYMLAARKVSRLAVGDTDIRPVAQTYEVSSLLVQDDRLSEELPFGSRGGLAIRHFFPADGEYVLSMRLQRDRVDGETIRGLNEPQELDVRLDGERVHVFTVGGRPASGSGTARAERGSAPADAGLEIRVPVKAGPRLVGVNLLQRTSIPEGVGPRRLPVWHFSTGREKMGITSLQIAGPYNVQGPGDTPSRRRIFVCRPSERADEETCATEILSSLARRAFRRPVADEDLAPLLRLYRDARGTGGFEDGIRKALEAVLVDPEFLFRIERDPVGVAEATAYALTDLELASRLSFFLWSSIPDDGLLDLAARGQLRDPAVFEREVRRMLADRRSSALVRNFGSQWLYLRNVQELSPDVNQFPEFDDNLREAFRRETELFLEEQFRDDRSVGDLLSANYTFVNERLARHYGIPNVYGSHFRRVAFPDERRAGLLGHGSILTVTSHANRTSPVVRGKWLLENILGAPPPPPPPNVPALSENNEGERPRSVRERMEQHRANPVCASCHAQMDPLGFALENFDAIGRWRDSEANVPIDSSAALPDGSKFSGPAELRSLLVSRREEFVLAVTSKLLTYAVGRGLDYYDKPAIRQIMRDAGASDYRWSSIILGITRSMPFQMRRSEP